MTFLTAFVAVAAVAAVAAEAGVRIAGAAAGVGAWTGSASVPAVAAVAAGALCPEGSSFGGERCGGATSVCGGVVTDNRSLTSCGATAAAAAAAATLNLKQMANCQS